MSYKVKCVVCGRTNYSKCAVVLERCFNCSAIIYPEEISEVKERSVTHYKGCTCRKCQEYATNNPDHERYFTNLLNSIQEVKDREIELMLDCDGVSEIDITRQEPEDKKELYINQVESEEKLQSLKVSKMKPDRCAACNFVIVERTREYVLLICPIEKESIKLTKCPKVGATWYKQ